MPITQRGLEGTETTGHGDDDHALQDDGDDGHNSAEFALPHLIFIIFTFFAAVVVRYLLQTTSTRQYKPPFTVIMGLIGVFCGVLNKYNAADGLWHKSVRYWEHVHPSLILFVLLPPLLFESAFSMKWHVFRKNARSTLILAGPGVVFSTALTGSAAYYLYGYTDGWDINTAMLIGSILSATDPVAVVAVLHTLGAPDKLSHLIEGESLLNDGTAFVVFAIFREFAGGVDMSPSTIFTTFLQLSLGGPLWGLAMGMGAGYALQLPGAHGDPLTEISLLVCGVYTTFFLAEHHLHVSGVLAVVAFGVYLGKEREIVVGRSTEKQNHEFWEMIGFLANSFIFVLSGLIINDKVHNMDSSHFGAAIWSLFAMYGVLHVVRGLMIYGMREAGLKHLGYGVNMNEAHVMVYSGLRGAVGLALAMEVEHDHRIAPEVQQTIMVQVGGIVALTLLINGTTAGLFYEYLNPYPEVPYRESLTVRALIQLDIEVHGSTSRHLVEGSGRNIGNGGTVGLSAQSAYRKKQKSKGGMLADIAESPFHGFADWPTVRNILPDVARVTRLGHVLVLDRSHPDVDSATVIPILESLEVCSYDSVLAATSSKEKRAMLSKSKVTKTILGSQTPWGTVSIGARVKKMNDELGRRRKSNAKVLPSAVVDHEDHNPHENQLSAWFKQQTNVVQGHYQQPTAYSRKANALREAEEQEARKQRADAAAAARAAAAAAKRQAGNPLPVLAGNPTRLAPLAEGANTPEEGSSFDLGGTTPPAEPGTAPPAEPGSAPPAEPGSAPLEKAPSLGSARLGKSPSLGQQVFGRFEGSSNGSSNGSRNGSSNSSRNGSSNSSSIQELVASSEPSAAMTFMASMPAAESPSPPAEKSPEWGKAEREGEAAGEAAGGGESKDDQDLSDEEKGAGRLTPSMLAKKFAVKFLQYHRAHQHHPNFKETSAQVAEIAEFQLSLREEMSDLMEESVSSKQMSEESEAEAVERAEREEGEDSFVGSPINGLKKNTSPQFGGALAAKKVAMEHKKRGTLEGAMAAGAAKQVEWAEKAAIGGLFGNIKDEVKVTVWEVVLKAMEMRIGVMYEDRTISGVAFQRLVECIDLAVDSLPLHEAAAVEARSTASDAAKAAKAASAAASAAVEALDTGPSLPTSPTAVDLGLHQRRQNGSPEESSSSDGGGVPPSIDKKGSIGSFMEERRSIDASTNVRHSFSADVATNAHGWGTLKKFVLVDSTLNSGFQSRSSVSPKRRGLGEFAQAHGVGSGWSKKGKKKDGQGPKRMGKAYNPFQVAWNMLEHSVDSDLDSSVRHSKNRLLYSWIRNILPRREHGLMTSVQGLMGFIAAVEQTSRSIASAEFENIFAEDPEEILRQLTDNGSDPAMKEGNDESSLMAGGNNNETSFMGGGDNGASFMGGNSSTSLEPGFDEAMSDVGSDSVSQLPARGVHQSWRQAPALGASRTSRMSGKFSGSMRSGSMRISSMRSASGRQASGPMSNDIKVGNNRAHHHRLPIVSWVLKQLNVVKLQAYGTLASMRLMFPAELKVIHTMLATDIALTFVKNKVKLLCDQGMLTHHTLEDILEVIKLRRENMHCYHLRYV